MLSAEQRAAFEMERIGREMVKRCKGLPLAISSLGGILKGKLLKEWEIINSDISFYLTKGGRVNDDEYYTVIQVLGLSYDSLPPRLRHCFLCFSNFEEDEVIRTDELYMLWMAEGLISVEDKAAGEIMLDVAERYLDELAHRSLVQVETCENEEDSPLKYETCRVHDLIRDLCLSKVKEERTINVIHLQRKHNDESKASIVRKLCIRSYDDGDESLLKPYDQHVISHIRSVFVWASHSNSEGVWPEKIFSLEKFKLLRVLTVRGFRFTKQDIRTMSKLVYLKYLCLAFCELKELPSSIGNLRNLETLDLRVYGLITIPNVLWKLNHLKHLYLPEELEEGDRVERLRFEGLNELELIYNYDSEYCHARDLILLRKLKVFRGKIIVEDSHTENFTNFLKSTELRHSVLDIEGEGSGLCLVTLLECCFINLLRIRTGICRFRKDYDHTRFSGRLTAICFNNSRSEQDPMILLEKLPNLRELYLDNNAYLGEEMVCTATGFPKLRYLYLHNFPVLRMWRVDEGAMPILSELEVGKCEKLEMLPRGLRFLTTLRFLHIFFMPAAFENRIQVIDGVEGEDFYIVSHIPNVHIRQSS